MSLTSLNQLLHLLADGHFHSGTDLGQHLNMSRAAVWKQLKGVEALGVQLHRVRGRGYRIAGGLDLLDLEAIQRQLPPLTPVFSMQLHMSLASTNQTLMQRVQQEPIHGQVVLAEVQTKGRGRLGRQWQSPFGQNIALSLGWRFAGGAAALEGLSLVVGLALVEALQDLGVSSAKLKWPNDVLADGKKLAGILLEMRGDATGPCHVVIGIGVNVHLQHSPNIDQPWVSLRQLGYHVQRNELVARLLLRLNQHLHTFVVQGFAPVRRLWQSYNQHQDQLVQLLLSGETLNGVCRGVNDTGAVLVEVGGELRAFNGGEISLRPQRGVM
ncbi:MAG: bifunctional biotin--[acetyl-CoA-carboxylase] ligase/biotin operon repressor BirA [Oceanospirillaceae bacterium]|jgi:BirA family biotin operon repressor/biotin-[acetyl-CoA-carboxylase] ligase|nr:bifunctional biotin--[acetyl-CoA-carboxylase] ligase/biotin operon repressor BirA [Oceanospirillaceae bacterium]MBT4442429.1 bifunctional biotin--[acetyl-CoA-carboxylase] ligase/biotin operon repressor BirA [Oceanospirillaceae bacterium]MBT6078380.1 bifunctional biotin--[acetyl-CoA-carboxylase] ligase/biotin operon repressor BirA [Oceanospirillaceae bacterium]